LHIVANPAVDPQDDSIILTRSGSRGQQLPVTLFRLERDGFLSEMAVEVLNPTGVAFDRAGELFVTARAEGEVVRIADDAEPFVTLRIGNRHRNRLRPKRRDVRRRPERHDLPPQRCGRRRIFCDSRTVGFGLSFGFRSGRKTLCRRAGLSSFDGIYTIDREGFDEIFYRGLGRPQGVAFDREGNLYVAACLHGRHGIVKIYEEGKRAEIFVAGMNVVGLCFTRMGEIVVATNEAVYSLQSKFTRFCSIETRERR
jgi:sugar lactone lactonase YvrE